MVTRGTLVHDALASSRAARAIFLKHGVNPEWCGTMRNFNTLGNAERWCGVQNVDRLIDDLNAATASESGDPHIRNVDQRETR